MSNVYLKVKIKSLTEEARIIRKEERVAKRHKDTTLLVGLKSHRLYVVRREARHSQLAYAFLRGMKYREVEKSVRKNHSPNWGEVVRMVSRYGSISQSAATDRVRLWRTEEDTAGVTPTG